MIKQTQLIQLYYTATMGLEDWVQTLLTTTMATVTQHPTKMGDLKGILILLKLLQMPSHAIFGTKRQKWPRTFHHLRMEMITMRSLLP